jgi:hypothetical protein
MTWNVNIIPFPACSLAPNVYHLVRKEDVPKGVVGYGTVVCLLPPLEQKNEAINGPVRWEKRE